MVWELIDQYIYLYIVLIGFYLYLYRKSQYLGAILLIVILLFSNVFIFNLILAPALVILTVITIVKVLVDNYEFIVNKQYKTIEMLEIIWAAIGSTITLKGIIDIFSISPIKLLNDLSSYDFLVVIYLIIIMVKFIYNNILNTSLEHQKSAVVLNNSNEELNYVSPKEVAKVLINDEENKKNNLSEIKQENIENASNEEDGLQVNSAPRRKQIEKSSNIINDNLVILLITLVFLVAGLSYYLIHNNTLKYDVAAHNILIYDHNGFDPEVTILSAEDEFRKDGDYTKLYNKYEEFGYTNDEIDLIFTDLTSDEVDRINKIDIKYEVSTSNVTYNDEITITATYNEDKAKKEKIKIINPQVTVKIDDIYQVATSENITDDKLSIFDDEIKAELSDQEITYNGFSIKEVYLDQTVENGARNLIIEYQLDAGQTDKLFGNKEVEAVFLQTNVYFNNQELLHDDKVEIKLDSMKINENMTKL